MLHDRFSIDLELQRDFKYNRVVGLSIQDSQDSVLAEETSFLETVSQVEPWISTVEETLVPHHSMVVVLVLLGEFEKIIE